MKISVIIPVYNVEEYLHYAMESLLKQTYNNFEIILVNDGSTDNSGELCNRYSEDYDFVRVYHKENGGLSDARNFGVNKSEGEFITFLDPDDFIEDYTLELMYGLQKEYNADLVATNIKVVYNHEINNKKERNNNIYECSNKEALELMYYNEIATVSACGKLFRREYLLDVPFPKGKIYEDLFIIADLLKNMKKIVITQEETYNYYQRENSIVNSPFSEKQYDYFSAIDNNELVIKKYYEDNQEILKALNSKRFIGSFLLSNMAIKSSKKDVKKIKKLIAPYYISLLLNDKVSMKRKIQATIFMMSNNAYYLLKNVLK